MQRWALMIVLALAACGGGSSSKADQGRSIADAAGLPKDVANFFALAASGSKATYQVALTTTDSNGKQVQVTTTQRPPNLRVDTFNADGTIDATFAVDGHRYQCTMSASQWQCGDLGVSSSNPDEVFGPTAVQLAIDRFKQRAADYDFRVEDRSIANTNAHCLVTTRKAGREGDPSLGAAATLCLSSEGAILRAETPSGTLTASSYSTSIPDDAFRLPAAISSASVSPASS